jgi:membrane protease YdiL (CAAX protease family)
MASQNEGKMARLRWVFVGPDGMRAGWGVFLFIGIIALIATVAHAFGVGSPPATEIPIKSAMISELCMVAVALVATSLVGWIERKTFWKYGFTGTKSLAKFVVGFVGGLTCLSLLVGALYFTSHLAFDGLALHGIASIGYGLAWLLAFFLTGVNEEFMLRGYLQTTLTRGVGKWPAFVLLSVLFTVLHLNNNGETAIGIAGVFAAGMLLSWLRWLSGSLWLGIGFHTAWDWAQSYLYGTPDSGMLAQGHLLISHAIGDAQLSGGSTGPEGSLLMSPMLIAGLLLLMLVLRRTGLIIQPLRAEAK